MCRNWIWWLTLACFLMGGCAARSRFQNPDRHFIILQDNLPLGTEVCVPSVLATSQFQYRCAHIDTIRWFLRHQEKG
jgi:hypothetical protein